MPTFEEGWEVESSSMSKKKKKKDRKDFGR